MLRALALALALVVSPRLALAQQEPGEDASTEVDLGTHPDTGLMIAGAVTFLAPIVVGLVALMPFEIDHCVEPGASLSLPPDHGYASCERAPIAGVPFAHLASGGINSLIAGPILLVHEVVGLFIFIGGAAHHHPNRPAPTTGSVRVSAAPGADVGLGLTVHF